MGDDLKGILAAPSTWLFGVGVSAFLGVWWWKMSPSTANLTLLFGVAALTLTAFLHPWTAAQGGLVRSLWAVATCSVLGLLINYTLWTKTDSDATKPPLADLRQSPPPEPVKLKFSEQQTIQYRRSLSPDVPLGNRQLNLGNAGRLVLFVGGDNPNQIILVHAAGGAPLSIDRPKGTVDMGRGMSAQIPDDPRIDVHGFTVIDAGGGKFYKFTRTGTERSHVIEASGRKFTVSLDAVNDVSSPGTKAIDWVFGINEE
jgi:hypothetical protein